MFDDRVNGTTAWIDWQQGIKELLALASKGRGGFWMGMTIASMLGGVLTWALGHFR